MVVVRDLPEPPRRLWTIVGPSIVAAGVGISSGEFILWPYIASQAGLVFLWATVLVRLGVLFWSILFFGVLAGLTVWLQVQRFL